MIETVTVERLAQCAVYCVNKPGCYAINTMETNDANCELTSGFSDVTELTDVDTSSVYAIGEYR